MSTTLTRRAPDSGRPSGSGRRSPHPALVLAIILATYLMIILDATIIITALPKIHRALGFSATGLSWVQNAYTLTFGGLLLLGARAGDILGRRRVFVVGIALFTSASLLGGLAQSSAWLLARPGRPGHRCGDRRTVHPRPPPDQLPRGPGADPGHRRLQRGRRRRRQRRPRARRHAHHLDLVALGRCSSTCPSASSCRAWPPGTCPRPSASARPLRPHRGRHLHPRDDRAGLRLRAGGLGRVGATRCTVASFVAGVALLVAFVLTERGPSSRSPRSTSSPAGSGPAPTSPGCWWSAGCSPCSSS